MAERFWFVVSLQGSRDDVLRFRKFVSTHREGGSDCNFDLNTILPLPSRLRLPYKPSTLLSYYAYRVVNEGRPNVEGSYWDQYLFRKFLREKERLPVVFPDYVSFIRHCDANNRFGVNLRIGEEFSRNLSLYGSGTSLEWARDNWGVVGNSVDCEHISLRKFAFALHGGVPYQMFSRVSGMFPDLLFTIRYAGDFDGKDNGFLQYYAGKTKCSDRYGERVSFPMFGRGYMQQPGGGLMAHDAVDNSVVTRWRSVIGCRGIPFSLGMIVS